MALKKGIWYRLSLLLAPPLYSGLTNLLFSSCRIGHHGMDHFKQCEDGEGPFIAAFWHYSVFYIIHRSKGKPWVAMVSASKDGEYVTRVLQKMGYDTVRGSRGKGGVSALKGMIASMGKGNNAAIVADGSQGPPKIVQAGVILLASRTGAPILPVVWSSDRYWLFKSWDRTVLPKPFSRIEVFYGKPMKVEKNIKSGDLEQYRLELENRLNDLYEEAWNVFGKKTH